MFTSLVKDPELTLSPAFLKARKDIDLSSIAFIHKPNVNEGKPCLSLRSRAFDPSTGEEIGHSLVTQTVEVRVTNFRTREKIAAIYFEEAIYRVLPMNHWRAFLYQLKRTSTVIFDLVLFNNNENMDAIGWSSHQLYGVIDEKRTMLASYTGPMNLAAPVRVEAPTELTEETKVDVGTYNRRIVGKAILDALALHVTPQLVFPLGTEECKVETVHGGNSYRVRSVGVKTDGVLYVEVYIPRAVNTAFFSLEQLSPTCYFRLKNYVETY
jgi:hypothetical protein